MRIDIFTQHWYPLDSEADSCQQYNGITIVKIKTNYINNTAFLSQCQKKEVSVPKPIPLTSIKIAFIITGVFIFSQKRRVSEIFLSNNYIFMFISIIICIYYTGY